MVDGGRHNVVGHAEYAEHDLNGTGCA
jgi:hypothetical protein